MEQLLKSETLHSHFLSTTTTLYYILFVGWLLPGPVCLFVCLLSSSMHLYVALEAERQRERERTETEKRRRRRKKRETEEVFSFSQFSF